MVPEYKHGDLSTKVDAVAFGLVVFETLTGFAVCSPAPGHRNWLSMFHELDTADKLRPHLHKQACWDQHQQERIRSLYDITDRCLELNRQKRPELVKLVPELGEVRHGTEALQELEAERAVGLWWRLRKSAASVSRQRRWVSLRVPCGHRLYVPSAQRS